MCDTRDMAHLKKNLRGSEGGILTLNPRQVIDDMCFNEKSRGFEMSSDLMRSWQSEGS